MILLYKNERLGQGGVDILLYSNIIIYEISIIGRGK